MTDRTLLRCIGRINIGNRDSSNSGLVVYELPELSKTPRTMSMSLSLGSDRCPFSDAAKIFEGDQRRGVFSFHDKLLGNAMVGVSIESSFAARKSLKMLLCAICATSLKVSFEIIKFDSGLIDFLARENFSHRVYCNVLDAEINTKNIRWNDDGRFRNFNDDTKIELFVSENQICLPSNSIQSWSMIITNLNRSLDSTMNSQQRNRIKPFPRKDSLVIDNGSIGIKGWFDRLISFIGFARFGNGSDSHLGGYTKLISDVSINNGLQLDFICGVHLKGNFSYIVASSIELMHSLMESIRLLRFNHNFDLESLHHDSIDVYDQWYKYLTFGSVQFLPRLKIVGLLGRTGDLMQYCTRNPAIKKPELSDAASIIDINDNMDVIDGIICKSNYNGGIDPGVNDDIGDGYSVGSHWWNVTDHRLFVAESVATGAAVWRQVYPTIDAPNHNLATAANDFLIASGAGAFAKKTLAETQAILGCRLTGWIDAPALTFSAADAPVYTVTCNGDYTLIIPVGARIALTHSGAIKYFIVVKTSYSSPNTTFTLYGGTDYTLATGAITNPYYSIAKAPVSFPLDPAKWTVTFTDSTKREQATPTAGTWYNLGSLSVAVPIGAWRVRSKILAQVNKSDGAWVDLFVTISTGNNNESTSELTDKVFVNPNDGVAFVAKAQGLIVLASKTTHYFNAKTTGTASSIEFSNDQTAMVVKFECAYL